jgi:hypothetical protein
MDSDDPLLAPMILNATTFLHWCNNTMMFNTHFQIIQERRTPCSCFLKFLQNSQMLVFLNPKRRLEAYPSQVWTWGLNQLLFKYMMCIQSWVNSGYNYLKYVRQVGLQVLKYLGMKWAPIPFWFELQFIYIYIYICLVKYLTGISFQTSYLVIIGIQWMVCWWVLYAQVRNSNRVKCSIPTSCWPLFPAEQPPIHSPYPTHYE